MRAALLLVFLVQARFGHGDRSLHAAIEQANAACDGTVECSILFDFVAETSIESVFPDAPLPAITACNLTIDRTPRPQLLERVAPDDEVAG